MAGQIPSVAEIVRLLHRLQVRFGSLSGFVTGIAEDARSRLDKGAVIGRE